MIRSELILRLHQTLTQSKKFNKLSKDDVENATMILLRTISQSLSTGRKLEIRGFGGFSLTHQKPRMGRNPKTGESVQVPAKYTLRFKMGKELQERVNQNK